MMKKLLCVIMLIAVISLQLAGCGNYLNPDDTGKNTDNTTSSISDLPVAGLYDESIISDYNKYNESQMNSLAMLNYYCIIAQNIISSKDNRLVLESVYSELYNNINPETVDKKTQTKILSMLDNLEDLRLVSIKRDRLKFLFEREQAQAVRKAIPDASQMLNVVMSGDYVRMIAAATLMVANSASAYMSAVDAAELNYITSGWDLDDEESGIIHENVKNVFDYMVSIVRDYGLKGEDTLSLEQIENFARNMNESNVNRQLAFLKDNLNIYKYYGGYWLLLAECSYKTGDYHGCYDAVRMYEGLSQNIFRIDNGYAKTIPYVIMSLENLGENEYIAKAPAYCKKLIDNTDESNWQMRLFASATYIDLYNRTTDRTYLERAYDQLKINIRVLANEQEELNKTFINDVVDKPIPADATKQQKKEIEAYNKLQKEKRKTELAPISFPLYTNLDMICTIADKLEKSDSEKQALKNIVCDAGKPIFLCAPLDTSINLGSDSVLKSYLEDTLVSYEKGELTIPSYLVTSESVITISIDGTECGEFTVDAVDRQKQYDFTKFIAKYSNSESKKFDYTDGSIVTITVTPYNNSTIEPLEFRFKAVEKTTMLVFKTFSFERIK